MSHQTTAAPFRLRTDRGSSVSLGMRNDSGIDLLATHDFLVTIDADDVATIVKSVSDELRIGEQKPAIELIALAYRSRIRRLIGKCRTTRQPQRDVFELCGLPNRHYQFVARLQSNPGSHYRVVITGCDISELIKRHREVERQAVLLEQVLAVAPHNIFWKDKDCRFLGGNANFLKTLGVDSIEDLAGKSDFDFSPAAEAEFYQTTDANVMLCGEPVVNLVERRTRDDGTEAILLTNKVPLRNKEGEIIGLLGVFEEITERKRMEESLIRRATHDDLTGLPNRRMLMERIGQSIGDPSSQAVSLLFMDIDGFKVVNDSLGHGVGDRLLVAIAERLSSVIGENQFLARLGGDEFAVLLNTESTDDAKLVSSQIVASLSKAFHIDDKEIYSSTSMGIVEISERYLTPDEVLRDADIAMYRAKSAGKSRHQLFDQSMYIEASTELTRQTEIRRAVEAMEFELYYQPVINLSTRACTGFEALIRWTPPGKQPVSPAMFVPYLEETGAIIPVGEWVIREACKQLRAWQDVYPDMQSLKMAVNLSSIQFNSARLVPTVTAAITEFGIRPDQLITEITETAVSDCPRQMHSKLQELRDLGIHVAMDDFGVGYSALGKLDQLPIDILKIDRSFVERIGSSDSEPLVKAVLQMTNTLGLTTIAEGIEHPHQANWLQAHGCLEAQGFLYARPLPAETDVHPFDQIRHP